MNKPKRASERAPDGSSWSINFISGLPRSGSTLLAALLRQNPRFHAGMSSPLTGLLRALIAEMSNKNEFSLAIDDAQRMAILRRVVQGFYDQVRTGDLVFDTNRAWCSQLPLLAALSPASKVIACVRDIPWVLNSVERVIRKYPLRASRMFQFNPAGTVYSRVDALTDSRGMVGYAYQALKDAFYSREATGRLIVLSYEGLVADPGSAMRRLYDVLEEPWFEHDFDHIAYNAVEFDDRIGLPGLHTVKHQITPPESHPVLPPDLFKRFIKDGFWHDPKNNIRGVPII